VRRPAVLLSLALLAGALLLRHRRRHAASGSLRARQPAPPPAPGGRAASGERFVSVPWELIEAPPDDPSLTIRYRGDKQMELDRVDAQETPTQVFVTALMRWRPPAGGWFAHAEEQEVVVPLSRPLGERELVHAPVDEANGPPLYP
jgi:hypothetical protein